MVCFIWKELYFLFLIKVFNLLYKIDKVLVLLLVVNHHFITFDLKPFND